MIYIFIICISLLLIFCLFSQNKSKRMVTIQESFENKAEEEEYKKERKIQPEDEEYKKDRKILPEEEEYKKEKKIQPEEEEYKKERKIQQENSKMGAEWEREIKDSTFNTNMPSQITYENILKFPDAEIKLEPRDKVYINPFFPDDKSKGTMQLETPRQNYPSLKDMTIVERNAFKFGYPDGMTMQDYVNWLYLFRKTPNLLNLEHNINYQKLIAGVPIYYKKDKTPPPAKILTPLNADDYFNKMYSKPPTIPNESLTYTVNEDVRVAANQGSSGIMPRNYEDYGDFSQNFDVRGTTGHIYNPELADKTDPYFLRNMIGPNWSIKNHRTLG